MRATAAVGLDDRTRDFYKNALELLNENGLPYLVGGAYAFERYTGIERHTKDFDIFIREQDYPDFERVFATAGYHTERAFPHWLGKAFFEDSFIDLIYASGNGIAVVDDLWFENAVNEIVFEIPVKLCPAEEIIWSKSFIMERERFDGADIAHIIRARAEQIDWDRLVWRFTGHWRILFSHLVLFGYIYPDQRNRIPAAVMQTLMERLESELNTKGDEGVCQGTLLSRQQYLVDVDRWRLADARELPRGDMSRKDIDHWTAAIED